MKVICINEPAIAHTRKGQVAVNDNMGLKKGETYTVVSEFVGYLGELKYVLKEKPANCRYKKSHFQTL